MEADSLTVLVLLVSLSGIALLIWSMLSSCVMVYKRHHTGKFMIVVLTGTIIPPINQRPGDPFSLREHLARPGSHLFKCCILTSWIIPDDDPFTINNTWTCLAHSDNGCVCA